MRYQRIIICLNDMFVSAVQPLQVTFSLPKHAARQSGPEEKYAEAFSPMGSAELWAVPRHKALE